MEIGITLFIVAALIIAIYVLIELKRFQHRLFAIVLIGLILFSYLSAAIIFRDKSVDLKTVPGIISATKIYFSWLGGIFGNFKSITANAIKMDWGTSNSTGS
ncbi:MAG: hypothetical protein ACE5ES_01755 [Candidatus Nanoarchaeia archaeon]